MYELRRNFKLTLCIKSIVFLLVLTTTYTTDPGVLFIPDPPSNSSTALQQTSASRAWTSPNISIRRSTAYSAENLARLVKIYQDHISTNDPVNEQYYNYGRLGDNVWFNIERVVPYKMFMDWAIATNKITNKFEKGTLLINQYVQKPDLPCAPQTAFSMKEADIMTDDKSRRIQLNQGINQWFAANQNTPPDKMCNRFRGLQCNPGKRVCECGEGNYVSFARIRADKPGEYRDGCYIKPWKSCRFLSLDSNIPPEYKSYHAQKNNMKQFLIRLATPLPRTSRCEKGSYCVDMILNQHHPICWCSSKMNNKDCYKANSSIPMVNQFLEMRKKFHQMIIQERDRDTGCILDTEVDENLQAIRKFLDNIEANYFTILKLMRLVIKKGGRFCDFRKGMKCDSATSKCTYYEGCGAGRIEDGNKVCKTNNGYPCPTPELQCVSGAECKDFGGGKHCHCSKNRFGELCKFENPSFFGSLLHSRVSGYVGYHFVNLQELTNHALTPLERLMTLGYNQPCNPSLDLYAMKIVKFMGNVKTVALNQMDGSLAASQYLVGRDEMLCNYKNFLRCTISGICEPMLADVASYELQQAPSLPGGVKIVVGLKTRIRCNNVSENTSLVHAIFQDIVTVQCLANHECRKREGQSSPVEKFCLCPVGFQGIMCNENVNTPNSPKNTGIQSILVVPRNKIKILRVSRCIRVNETGPCVAT